jgi:photosystem II stability/assembly factor-like uncharacterized protein
MIVRPRRATLVLLAAVLAFGIGGSTAILASPGAIAQFGRSRSHAIVAASTPSPSPSPIASPSPSPSPKPAGPAAVGSLGQAVRLVAGAGLLRAVTGSLVFESKDSGQTWSPVPLPTGTTDVALDSADPQHLIAGGPALQSSTDGGQSWRSVRRTPPAAPPYKPLAISLSDKAVWFVAAQGRLLRTRDDGVSWRDLQPVVLGNTVAMAEGSTPGQFFIGGHGRLWQLDDNGQKVTELAALGNDLGDFAEVVFAGPGPALLLTRTTAGKAYLYLASQSNPWRESGANAGGPVAAGGGMLLVGDGRPSIRDQGRVAVSLDGGATWKEGAGLTGQQGIVGLAVDSTTPLAFAYGVGGDLFSSQDKGATWALTSMWFRAK